MDGFIEDFKDGSQDRAIDGVMDVSIIGALVGLLDGIKDCFGFVDGLSDIEFVG